MNDFPMSTPSSLVISTSGNLAGTSVISLSSTAPTYQVTVDQEYGWGISSKPIEEKPLATISASLYFKYVKLKLTRPHVEKLKRRLAKLTHLQVEAQVTGQVAMLEEVERELVVTAKEQLMLTSGLPNLGSYVDKARVTKHLARVAAVRLTTLEKFPRPLPANVASTLKKVLGFELFDEFWVLYTDYTGPTKTTADKIKEKDPILFGVIRQAPERYYFVADWVDEFCDLTLAKLVEMSGDFAAALTTASDLVVDRGALAKLSKRLEDRLERLAKTSPGNFRELEKAERAAAAEPSPAVVKAAAKPSRGFWAAVGRLFK